MSHYSVAEVSTCFLEKLFSLLYLARLDSQCYFWQPTGRLALKRELATNTVLTPDLSGFNPHRWASSLSWNITITNDDKGGNPAITAAVHHTVIYF